MKTQKTFFVSKVFSNFANRIWMGIEYNFQTFDT